MENFKENELKTDFVNCQSDTQSEMLQILINLRNQNEKLYMLKSKASRILNTLQCQPEVPLSNKADSKSQGGIIGEYHESVYNFQMLNEQLDEILQKIAQITGDSN